MICLMDMFPFVCYGYVFTNLYFDRCRSLSAITYAEPAGILMITACGYLPASNHPERLSALTGYNCPYFFSVPDGCDILHLMSRLEIHTHCIGQRLYVHDCITAQDFSAYFTTPPVSSTYGFRIAAALLSIRHKNTHHC